MMVWNVVISVLVFVLSVKVLFPSSIASYMSIPSMGMAHALDNEKVEKHFIIFLATTGTLTILTIIGFCTFIFCYMKRKWIRQGYSLSRLDSSAPPVYREKIIKIPKTAAFQALLNKQASNEQTTSLSTPGTSVGYPQL